MTNEEYIKSLTTEQLACWIHKYATCTFCEEFIEPIFSCGEEAEECEKVFIPRNIREWLLSERTVNET
jgi:hypothetical protein